MAQQMMSQQGGIAGPGDARRRGAAPAAAPGIPETLSPAEAAKALGVSEADVIASLESGDLKGKRIGSQWRITQGGARAVPARVGAAVSRAGRRRRQAAKPSSTARQKYHCPACGAEAHWNPAKQALVCPFCGTESPAHGRDAAAPRRSIVEHDLAAALRSIPDSARGWQAAKISVRCQSCQAISRLRPRPRGPALRLLRLVRPRALRGGRRTRSGRSRSCRSRSPSRRPATSCAPGTASLWFAPAASARRPSPTRSRASTSRTGRSTRRRTRAGPRRRATTTTSTENGKQERQRPLDAGLGSLCRTCSTTSWCAPRAACDPACCARSSRSRRTTLVPYDPGYLAGWVVERYQIDLVGRRRSARGSRWTKRCGSSAPSEVPGRHPPEPGGARELSRPDLQAHPGRRCGWSPTRYHGKAYQVVVNGVTGKMSGARPWSWLKIALAVSLARLSSTW